MPRFRLTAAPSRIGAPTPLGAADLCHPIASHVPFTHAGWLFELKHDGFRALARTGRDRLAVRRSALRPSYAAKMVGYRVGNWPRSRTSGHSSSAPGSRTNTMRSVRDGAPGTPCVQCRYIVSTFATRAVIGVAAGHGRR